MSNLHKIHVSEPGGATANGSREDSPRTPSFSPFDIQNRQQRELHGTVDTEQLPGSCWAKLLDKVAPPAHAVIIHPEVLILGAVAYGVLFFSMGSVWLPGNPAFCTALIWASSLFGAEIARWLRLPRVVGMLGAGLLLANTPGNVVAAFPRKWGTQMRAAALATIFLRCGLELEFKTMNLYKWPALRLAFVPGIIEALFDAGVAAAVFGMPYPLALSMGFILKAVGPGLVVPAMFVLQKEGWGAEKGIPSTVVIAASFDDIIAITGFSIFINIAIAGGHNAAWQIASGPLQVLFGIAGGAVLGAILGCTKVWNNKYKRLIGLYGAALLLMFFLEYFEMLSGGALGSLAVGLVTCFMWERGVPKCGSSGASSTYAPDIERVVAKVWNWAMEPLLFGTIGTSIMFVKLQTATIPKAVLIVVTGVTLRVISTFVIMFDRKYTWRERLFYAVAWTPKATVQASLSSVPLAMIESLIPLDSPDRAVWVQWGQEILTTGVFAIIICGSLGTLLVFVLTPVLLHRGEAPSLARARSEARLPGKPSMDRGPGAQRRSVDFPSLTRATTSTTQYSGPLLSMDDLHGIRDHSLIEEYFDAIDQLLRRVREEPTRELKAAGAMELCNNISSLQERIDREVGPREMTVRQMLHHTALRSRQASLSASGHNAYGAAGGAGGAGSDGMSGGGGGGGRVVVDVRHLGKGTRQTLESVQSYGDAVVDPAEEVEQVAAVAALARAMSVRSGGSGSVSGASPARSPTRGSGGAGAGEGGFGAAPALQLGGGGAGRDGASGSGQKA